MQQMPEGNSCKWACVGEGCGHHKKPQRSFLPTWLPLAAASIISLGRWWWWRWPYVARGTDGWKDYPHLIANGFVRRRKKGRSTRWNFFGHPFGRGGGQADGKKRAKWFLMLSPDSLSCKRRRIIGENPVTRPFFVPLLPRRIANTTHTPTRHTTTSKGIRLLLSRCFRLNNLITSLCCFSALKAPSTTTGKMIIASALSSWV